MTSGFDFSDYCNGPYKEYPLKTSSSGYTGGSPGADRVVYDSNDGTFCGAVSPLPPYLSPLGPDTIHADSENSQISLRNDRLPTPALRATTLSSATTKRTPEEKPTCCGQKRASEAKHEMDS